MKLQLHKSMTVFYLSLLILSPLWAKPLKELQLDFTPKNISGRDIISSKGKQSGKFVHEPNIIINNWKMQNGNYLQFDKINHLNLPKTNFSVEVLVSITEGTQWGSIIGNFQDNGSYEKGWMLGYNNSNFTFGLSTGPKLLYAASKNSFKKKQLYYLSATYDGKDLKLYVDGKLSGSTANPGKVDYADYGSLVIGSYKDKDENNPMRGSLIRAEFLAKVLTASEIKKRAISYKKLIPQTLNFSSVPNLKFTSPSSATVNFGLLAQYQCDIRLINSLGQKKIIRGKRAISHSFNITKLAKGKKYKYQIIAKSSGQTIESELYNIETSVNYALPTLSVETSSATTKARQMIKLSSTINGHCAIAGNIDPELVMGLVANSQMYISILSTDPKKADELRHLFYKKKVYGSRVNVYLVDSYDSLSLAHNIYNLFICLGTSQKNNNFMKHVKPGGVMLSPDKIAFPSNFSVLKSSLFSAARKDALKGHGEWNAQYGRGNNSAYSGESLNKMDSSDKLKLQWIGRPSGDFGIDRNPRMPAPLAAGGRLFHQGMNRMIALDAHNGAILWSLEIPHLRRVNIPRDASNWCTDGKNLYTAILDQMLIIDTNTGNISKTLRLPKSLIKKKYEWGFIGQEKDRLYGSAVRKDSIYKDYWSGSSWYDKKDAASTAKVCSDFFFCYSKTGKALWKYKQGLIINTTICYQQDRVYFIETRNPTLLAKDNSRFAEKELWDNQFLVCLDGKNGKKLWDKAIDTVDGDIVFYMQTDLKGIYVSLSSTKDNNYHIYKFNITSGKEEWHVNHRWPSGDHSGHMLHPVIVNNKIYLEPKGYDLSNGKKIFDKIGRREGCHGYVGVDNALIFRGTRRQISIWSMKNQKTTTWTRLRPSCWLSMIPAAGMLLVPEGGGGCSCGGWMETSLGFTPWENK